MPAVAQPIETAPRDGSVILGMDHAGWREMWFVRDPYEGEFWRDHFDSEPAPTLWTELPGRDRLLAALRWPR